MRLGLLASPPNQSMGSFYLSSLSLLAFLILHASLMLSLEVEDSSRLYIVYLGERKHKDPDDVTASHHDLLTSILGSKDTALASIVYSYRHGFSGFAAMLTESQAKRISELPNVISVKLSRNYQLQTTRSWDYLGLNYKEPTKLLRDSNFGDGIIIGVIDSGIWPESPSFSDEGHGPIPSRWKGKCQTGEAFGANNCSGKIIGARYYPRGIEKKYLEEDYLSPRCLDCHGTLTASTAAGSPVENVSFHDLGIGTARGGAPRARLAIYKAIWGSIGTGNTATVLAAMDDAIHDGVDILSLSLKADDDSFGSLHAAAKGITVVYAGGNSGPFPQTVVNTAPWVITVAASTIDRSFPTKIILGNSQSMVGQSIFYDADNQSHKSFRKLVDGQTCTKEYLKGSDVAGKVVLCAVANTFSIYPFPAVVSNVLQAGGRGLIFAQSTTDILDFIEQCKGIPCVYVDFYIGNQILMYVQRSKSPMAKVKPTRNVVGREVLSPKVAAFSSRGPSIPFPGVLKPDIAAPGVSILAAYGNSYKFASGTSLACPHVSGVAALLKSVHPNWSHAAIKSSLVTTASITDGYGMPIQAEGLPRKLADPFDFGGGQIDANRAADPGLIYDIDPRDYYKFFNCTFRSFETCDTLLQPVYNLNLPSISIPGLRRSVTVWRTVTNVGQVDAIYKPIIESPPGVEMTVKPLALMFNSTCKKNTFKVNFLSTHTLQGDYTFGSLSWYDGANHLVRIPIAVRTIIEDFYADTA